MSYIGLESLFFNWNSKKIDPSIQNTNLSIYFQPENFSISKFIN